MRRLWPQKPELSQLLPTFQARGYSVVQGEAKEWWICQGGQVWARLSNSSRSWCLDIIAEEEHISVVRVLLLEVSVLRETLGFLISYSATSIVW